MSKKTFLLLIVLVVGSFVTLWTYVDYIQKEKYRQEEAIYKNEAVFMQKNLAAMIEEKKKSTTAIAITLASNDLLPELIEHKKLLRLKLNTLISNFKKYTNYKNIWIHILDKNLHSIYRSWTDIKDDRFCSKREDLRYVLKNKKIISLVGMDIFSVNIKAIVPLYNKKRELLGVVEVISHFNSISNGLKKLDIDSVVLVDKEHSKEIKYPFTANFLENCYVANFDAPSKLLEYLKKRKVENYCKEIEKIEDDYLIASYPLKAYNGDIVAYYIMFKNIATISKTGLNYFVFRWSVFAIILLMALAGVINIILYFHIRKQKAYYKKILDTASNIVLVNDKKNIIDANKTFFKYFKKYKTIEEFRDENICICKFFVEDGEYLKKGKSDYSWLEYVIKNQDKVHKVKMNIESTIYYFMVYVSLISDEQEHYSVIFSDITEQELYKKELEKLSMQDPLTHIGNRRKYQQRIEKEMARACRYKTTFSIIEFDIDHFKQVNDTQGHIVGDKVLREYAQLVSSLLRDVDEVFRIGGEEFIIVAPHTNRDEAHYLAEKLRKAIQNHHKITDITASFGVTEYRLCEEEDELFKRVDYALYEAKNSGRNKVVVG